MIPDTPARSSLTTTLALLFCAAQRKWSQFEYELHDILNGILADTGWPDERKADLYATCVETVKATDTLKVLEQKCAHALRVNAMRFPDYG
jgi:hypothetical protein